MSKELETLAADSSTSPRQLRELAANHPSLRPIIAMNPAAYPSLLQWLSSLGDPAINVALQQRLAAERARDAAQQGTTPQRVSVLQRAEASPQANTTAVAPATQTPTDAGHVGSLASQSYPNQGYRPRTDSHPVVRPTVPVELPPRRNKTIWAWVLSGAALVVVTIAVILIVGLMKDREDTTATPSSPNGTATQVPDEAGEEATDEDAAPKEPETETEDEPEAQVLYPAPDSALHLAHVVAPSGNISCIMDLDGVTCSINTYSFTGPTLSNCESTPVTFSTEPDGVKVSCSVPPVRSQGAVTLAYGDFATNSFGACQSTEQGLICWNTSTGRGFAVARQGYTTGTEGLIPRSTLPWP